MQFSLQSEIWISGAARCVLSLQPSRGPYTVQPFLRKSHHCFGGGLVTTQKPWFWEQRHKSILSLLVYVKLKKKVELSEHCDGMGFSLSSGGPLSSGRDCPDRLQERREVTLLSPFSYISAKVLQWKSVENIYWTHSVGLISVTRQLTCFKGHWGKAEYYQPVRLQIPDYAGEESQLFPFCVLWQTPNSNAK